MIEQVLELAVRTDSDEQRSTLERLAQLFKCTLRDGTEEGTHYVLCPESKEGVNLVRCLNRESIEITHRTQQHTLEGQVRSQVAYMGNIEYFLDTPEKCLSADLLRDFHGQRVRICIEIVP